MNKERKAVYGTSWSRTIPKSKSYAAQGSPLQRAIAVVMSNASMITFIPQHGNGQPGCAGESGDVDRDAQLLCTEEAPQ